MPGGTRSSARRFLMLAALGCLLAFRALTLPATPDGGNWWEDTPWGDPDRGYGPDTDFASAIAMMEIARQGANYSIFKGEAEKCSVKLIKNCCKTQGGGMSGRNYQRGPARLSSIAIASLMAMLPTG